MEENKESLCPDCISSLWCETWGEIRCLAQKKRIYGYKKLTDPAQCKFYSKRPARLKELRCQCEDCMKNELQGNEYLEE